MKLIRVQTKSHLTGISKKVVIFDEEVAVSVWCL